MIKFKATSANRLIISNWLSVKDNSPALNLMYRETKYGNRLMIVSNNLITPDDKPISLSEIQLVS